MPPQSDAGMDAAATLDASLTQDAAVRLDGGSSSDADTTQSVTFSVGPNGGHFELLGIVIDIPAFALTEAVELTLELTEQPPPNGYEAYSPVYRLTPSDLALETAILVTIPFSGDPAAAAGLVSKTGAVYDRVSGSASTTGLTFRVEHAAWLFVGNGQSLPPRFDPVCVRSRVLAGRTAPSPGFPLFGRPAQIGLLANLEDCEGRPITDLATADFGISEDNIPLEVPLHLFAPSTMPQYVMIAIDISTSALVTRAQVIQAAKAFVRELLEIRQLDARIGVFAFDGRASIYHPPVARFPMPFSPSSEKIYDALDKIAALSSTDPGSTNLNGAISEVLRDLAKARSNSSTWNNGGTAPVGHAVVFTAGHVDTNGSVSQSQVLSTISGAPDYLTIVSPGVPEAVLQGLKSLAGRGLFVSQDIGSLEAEAIAAARRVHAQAKSTYLLGYCSPTRSTQGRTAKVVLKGAENQGSTGFVFTGDFDATCTFDSFTSKCKDKACGGLYCGGCDEDSEYCASSSSTCLPGTAEAAPIAGGTDSCGTLGACNYPKVCCNKAFRYSNGQLYYQFQCVDLSYCKGEDVAYECESSSDCGQPGLCCTDNRTAAGVCRRDTCNYNETPTEPIIEQDGGSGI